MPAPDLVIPRAAARIRIVLFEDHPQVREGLTVYLREELSMNVVAALPDGRAALEAVRRHEPDVVLMDLSMPLVDGAAATRSIRTGFPCLPIIALSVSEEEDSAVRGVLAAGATTFISKFVFEALGETIRACLTGNADGPAAAASA